MRRARPAFTLLEILLAMTIFALVMISVTMTFRTASRSYERSARSIDALQRARGVVDVLSRDLRSAFLITETRYGALLPANEHDSARFSPPPTPGELDALQEDRTIRDANEILEENEFRDLSLNPGLGLMVVDNGEFDAIRFTRRLRSLTGRRTQPGGIVEVTYQVRQVDREDEASTWIIERLSTPIFDIHSPYVRYADETAEEAIYRIAAEVVPEEEPESEMLASGVRMFDIRCIHWAGGEWAVSSDGWDSGARVHRNSLVEVTLDEDDPNRGALNAAQDQMLPDALPAAIELTLELAEPGGRVRHSRHVIPVASALETWMPPDPRLVGDARE